MCHQPAGLIQSIIETAGIPTASVSAPREVTQHAATPRVLSADFPLGYSLGAAQDAELQSRIILAMLTLSKEPLLPGGVQWQSLASGRALPA